MTRAKWCEIEDCCNAANSTTNGIRTCERCRIHFESVGMGAVYFGGRWHGVTGATYTDEHAALFPGVRRPAVAGDPRGGSWARQSREGR